MPTSRYVAFHAGAPIAVGDQLLVDHNYFVTLVAIVDPGRITVRWDWGAVEDIKASRAAVTIDRA